MTGANSTELNLGIVGAKVDTCTIDYAFTLRLTWPTSAAAHAAAGELRIESPFTCARAGTSVLCIPSRDPASAGPALQVLRQTLTAADVDATGVLRLQFDQGTLLEVAPDPDFEAWTLVNSSGTLIVCGAEGIIHVFPPKTPSSP